MKSAPAWKTIPRKGRRVQGFASLPFAPPSAPKTQKERVGEPARSFAKPMGEALLLDAILERLACVECRKPGCRDLDALSGLGIATLARFALAGLEGSESRDLNLLPGHESGRDQSFLAWGEKRFDGGTRFTCRKTGLLCNGGDEFGLVHLRLTSSRLNNGRQLTPHPRGCQMDS